MKRHSDPLKRKRATAQVQHVTQTKDMPQPGKQLRRLLMEKQNLSISEVAITTGLSRSTVYSVFQGYTHITPRTAFRMERNFPNLNAHAMLYKQAEFDLKVQRWINS